MRSIPKNRLVYFIIFDALLIGLAVSAYIFSGAVGENDNMKISSTAFQHDGLIPAEYTCDGPGISPPLSWSEVPDNTKSLVLVVDDPDAPSGTWTHWTVWNIAPDSSGTEAGGVPSGATQGLTSAGTVGWHGPCPPFGSHRYFFKLFALDVQLGLAASNGVGALDKEMEGHIIDKAGLIGRYERKNP